MDYFVCVHDLFNQALRFLVIHRPDLFNPLVVGPFEPFETLLKFDELVSEELIFFCVLVVQILRLGLLNPKVRFFVVVVSLDFLQFVLEALLLLSEDLLPLEEDVMVEAQLFMVQLVDRYHVLHALFEDLHFRLELDFLLSLFVGIASHGVLEVFGVIVFLLLAPVEEVFLALLVLIEESVHLIFVAGEDVATLTVEL